MTMYYAPLDYNFMSKQVLRWEAEAKAKADSDRKLREKAEVSKHGLGLHLAAKLDD